MATVLEIALSTTRKFLEERVQEGADGAKFYELALALLVPIEARKDQLQVWTMDQLEQVFRMALVTSNPAQWAAVIATMDADTLIGDMRSGSAAVALDTAARQARTAAALDLLKEVGTIGAKFALALLF